MTESEWLDYHRKSWPWMTDDQFECACLLADLFGGFHHMNCRKVEPSGNGISYLSAYASFASFDSDRLTKLVFLAHDRCVRVEIEPRAFRYLNITLYKRHLRLGRIFERHPTIEEALQLHRIYFPLPE